ncbi:hypothetical protein ATANTOWER_002154 [Ataeniobius toweri]|uniref:Uncharacterized protein n=1 Tax=Ataeniobius toweri TaxID=208326 RepID=A0ABU7AW54_9TELE|nr:hypothetical protein [Ataeniobius toweri]
MSKIKTETNVVMWHLHLFEQCLYVTSFQLSMSQAQQCDRRLCLNNLETYDGKYYISYIMLCLAILSFHSSLSFLQAKVYFHAANAPKSHINSHDSLCFKLTV